MYLYFYVVAFLTIYACNWQNTMKDCWSRKWQKLWIESNKQPFVSLCSDPDHWTLACKWQLALSYLAKRTLALEQSETHELIARHQYRKEAYNKSKISDFPAEYTW